MRMILRDLSESEKLEAETLHFVNAPVEKSATDGWHICRYALQCAYLNYEFRVLLEESKSQFEKQLSWKIIASNPTIDEYFYVDFVILVNEFANENDKELSDFIELESLQHICYSYFLKAEKLRDAKNKLGLEKMIKEFNNLERKIDRLNERFDDVFRE